MRIEFTILGQPASKSNRRRIVKIGDVSRSIKSPEALAFEKSMLKQIPPKARVRLTGPVRIAVRIWYASNRSDLDETVVLDCLQDRYATRKTKLGKVRDLVQHGVYRNDRQVHHKVIVHAIDRNNPRVHVIIEPLEMQQLDLALVTSDPFDDNPFA
jgi:Holliday junction resolvase RusA-like endonuclease